jgi:NADPH:quinone reductase-like Zn-dependent oxidoreductase
MRAVLLRSADRVEGLSVEEVPRPTPAPGEALIRVRAAAITRDELDWPVDRLPAIPSYELSGVVDTAPSDDDSFAAGDAVYGLTGFDRDGVAADYAAVPVALLAPKPVRLDDVEAAAVPLAGLTAWQGLVEHGGLTAGQRVLILGAAGGVGHLATQLARSRGAHVVATASAGQAESARRFGAHEVLEDPDFEDELAPVDLVFDTVGGEWLRRSARVLRDGGRLVSVAEKPPVDLPVHASYFVVEPNRGQLVVLAGLIDAGDLRPAIDSVFPLSAAREAFERSMARGKSGKVVLRVADD